MDNSAASVTTAESMFSELQKWATAERPAIVGVIAVREPISEKEGEISQCSLFIGPDTISPAHLRLLGQMFLFEAERLAERIEAETLRPPTARLH